jgi:hypothetical protein
MATGLAGEVPVKMRHYKVIRFVLAIMCVLSVIGTVEVRAQRAHGIVPTTSFGVIDGEVLDIQDQNSETGTLIFLVRDIGTGKKMKLRAHQNRTTVQIKGQLKSVDDVLGGNQGLMMYERTADGDAPELIFLKITKTYDE